MPNTIRLRRGSTAPTASSFAEGEPGWDSTNSRLYVKNAAGVMVRIGNPDFGSENITTTGTITGTLTPPAGLSAAGEAPLKFTSGTNLATPELGAVEFDGTHLYATPAPTTGRGQIPVLQTFRLTSVGANIGPTIGDYFGANSSISLAASSVYDIEMLAYLQKNTAGTLTWSIVGSLSFSLCNATYTSSPVTGIQAGTPVVAYAGALSSPANFAATASISNNAFMAFYFKVQVITNSSLNLRLRVTNSAGTVTPQAGSFYTVRQIAPSVGFFAA